MEGSRFNFKFLSSLSIRCDKINVSEGLPYIKSLNLFRHENATIIQKNINDRCLQYDFTLIQHYKKTQKSS